MERALWRCPVCGRSFANRNQPHSCGSYTVEAFLEGKTAEATSLFEGLTRMVARCGPFLYAPAKTRVGFQVRMIFASVNGLSKDGMRLHLCLPHRIDDPRFERVETLGARCYVHHLRIRSTAELDDRLEGWMRESYAMGRQDHLVRDRHA